MIGRVCDLGKTWSRLPQTTAASATEARRVAFATSALLGRVYAALRLHRIRIPLRFGSVGLGSTNNNRRS